MKRLTLVVLFTLSVPLSSLAWNHEGHLTVSAIAYSQMNQGEKQRIDAILRFHPAYWSWLGEYNQGHPNGMTPQAFAFIRAAAWPDDIRNTIQDRPPWHYVNYPVTLPNVNTTTPIGDGVLHIQLQQCMNDVRNETAPTHAARVDRAIKLSWVLHLIGDLHQPLHSVALVNQRYPQGDRGGNLFFIRTTAHSDRLKLHTFWDNVLGDSWNLSDAATLALQITQQIPPTSAMLNGNYHDWIVEASNLAVANVYRFRLNNNWFTIQDQGAVLPQDYQSNARRIATMQVALAGYRLKNTLAQLIQ